MVWVVRAVVGRRWQKATLWGFRQGCDWAFRRRLRLGPCSDVSDRMVQAIGGCPVGFVIGRSYGSMPGRCQRLSRRFYRRPALVVLTEELSAADLIFGVEIEQ
ncbi:hypothetical protein Dimus_018471 [Dionaea muscipula]